MTDNTSRDLDHANADISTYEHLDHVRKLLRVFANALLERGETHDRSKIGTVERDTFAEYASKLKGCIYGSPEYKAQLKAMSPALVNHYACNRHHPEHFAHGIHGMNLIDLLEMFVDWKASTLRHATGDIRRSIEINKTRFGMSEQLVNIFMNTVADLDADALGSNTLEVNHVGLARTNSAGHIQQLLDNRE